MSEPVAAAHKSLAHRAHVAPRPGVPRRLAPPAEDCAARGLEMILGSSPSERWSVGTAGPHANVPTLRDHLRIFHEVTE